MINIDFYLRKRKDLCRLSELESQIALLITDIYYSDPLRLTCEVEKEESLPFILYFNLLRQLISDLTSDPFPQQLVTVTFKRLESCFEVSAINYSAKIKTLEEYFFSTPSLAYETNFEFERILIWGGLYVLIRKNHKLFPEGSDKICQTMLTCVTHNPYKEDYFDPFLHEILQEEIPECRINQDLTDEEQVEELVELTTEEKLAMCFTVDGVLDQAANYFYDQPNFVETLKTLLRQTVNEQSGGDPHVQNLLQAKLKILSAKAKNKRQERQRRSTPKFLHLVLHPEPKKFLERLHQLIDGKSGAAVGAVLLRAQQKGYLSDVPTKMEFESEFTLIGKWNAIQNYTSDSNLKALAKANKIIIFEGE